MFGYFIVRTSEAFEGYDIDHTHVGAVANSKDEMYSCIIISDKNKLRHVN